MNPSSNKPSHGGKTASTQSTRARYPAGLAWSTTGRSSAPGGRTQIQLTSGLLYGRNGSGVAQALERWAELRLDQGDGANAETLLLKALPLREPGSNAWAENLDRLASLRSLRGDLASAEALYRKALEAERSGARLRSLAASTPWW